MGTPERTPCDTAARVFPSFCNTPARAGMGQGGPPDFTVPGFGVPIGSAYLSARRTFGRPIGRPKVRPYLRPNESAARSAGRRYGLICHPPLYYYPQILTLPIITNKTPSAPQPFWHTTNSPSPRSPQPPPPPRPQRLHAKVVFVPLNHPPPLPPKPTCNNFLRLVNSLIPPPLD